MKTVGGQNSFSQSLKRLEDKWGDTDELKSFADAVVCLDYALRTKTPEELPVSAVVELHDRAEKITELQYQLNIAHNEIDRLSFLLRQNT